MSASQPGSRSVVGIDFAAQPENTWAAFGETDRPGCVRIKTMKHPVSDDDVLDMVQEGPAVVAIDVPFGWPDGFVSFVSQYHRQETPHLIQSIDFQFRVTDRFVRQKTEKRPLSVSTNLIGITAHRMATLMTRLPPCDVPPLKVQGNQTGVIEVYPSATLIALGLPGQGYKKASVQASEARTSIVDKLQSSGVEFAGSTSDTCRRSHDALDACICALTASTYLGGGTWQAPNDPVVKREGWIFFPKAEH